MDQGSSSPISVIVAYDRNRLIGANGKLPWGHLQEEMKHFRETTIGNTVIMGRNTWDSLPDKYRPLPQRFNIVITSNPATCKQPGVTGHVEFANTPIMGLDIAKYSKEIFIIGGAQVYKAYLDLKLVNRILASEIKAEYSGDTYFPNLDTQLWTRNVVKEYEGFSVVEFKRSGS